MWTDPWWFIYQLEVQIWFWSSAAWPPTFLYWSFSTLYASSLWRTDTIVVPKLNNNPPPTPPKNKPPSLLSAPSNRLQINKPPGRGQLKRGFTVYRLHWSWISLIEVYHAKFHVSTLNPLPNPGILPVPLQTSTTFFIWSYKTSRPCNFTRAASLLNHCNKHVYNLKEYNVSNQAYIYLNWNCTTLRNPSTVKKMFKN